MPDPENTLTDPDEFILRATSELTQQGGRGETTVNLV